MSVTVVPIQAEDFYSRIQKMSHGMTYVIVPEVNMLKNSSTHAISVPINISIKLRFVSVNDRRETYFEDALRTYRRNLTFFFSGQ